MGNRGPGATKKARDEGKLPGKAGRPRNKGPKKIVGLARKAAPDAIKFLKKIVADETQETRHRVRAAAELVKFSVLEPAEPEKEPGEGGDGDKITVSFPAKWGGPPSRKK